jgi:hypothetical protein
MGLKKEDLHRSTIGEIYEGWFTEQGDMTMYFEHIQASDPASLYKGLPDDRCQSHHYGFLFKGKIVVRYADREEEINAGEAYYMAPGHLPLIVEESETLEISPTGEFETTMAQCQKNLETGVAVF